MPSFYTSPRVKEISQTLIDDRRLFQKIMRFGMIEKTPLLILKLEEWSDWDGYRYQPRGIASAVAFAEWHRDILDTFQRNKAKAQREKKNAQRKIPRQIKKIEDANKKDFDDLPSEIRMSSFFKRDGDGNQTNYRDAMTVKRLLKASQIELETPRRGTGGGQPVHPQKKGYRR